jgi:hypothetical protein
MGVGYLNLCRSCDQDFASVAAFDQHRVGVHAYSYWEGLRMDPPVENGRRCLAPEEMRERGMSENARGRWQIDAAVARAREHFRKAAPRSV